MCGICCIKDKNSVDVTDLPTLGKGVGPSILRRKV